MKKIQYQKNLKRYIRTWWNQGIAMLGCIIKSYWTDTDTYILRGDAND